MRISWKRLGVALFVLFAGLSAALCGAVAADESAGEKMRRASERPAHLFSGGPRIFLTPSIRPT